MWTFVATDRLARPLGELRGFRGERVLRFPLSKTPTFSFTLDAEAPLAGAVLLDDLTMVKAMDDAGGSREIRLLGPVVSHEKVRNADGGTIAAVAGGPQTRLARRLIGRSADGFSTTGGLDHAVIAGQIIDALSAGALGLMNTLKDDTGIRVGTITPTGITAPVGPWRYKVAADALAEMAAVLDGYEWEVAPVAPVADALGVKIGEFNCGPILGQLRPDVVWEFGTGQRNVAEWRDVGDTSSLANAAVNLPANFPTSGDPVVSAGDAASRALRGLNETVVDADLQTTELRQLLVSEHVRIRSRPRRVISFTPTVQDDPPAGEPRRVPRFGVEYGVGDIMRLRCVEPVPIIDPATGAVSGYRDQTTIDALFRVYVVTVTLDEQDAQRVDLTLIEET